MADVPRSTSLNCAKRALFALAPGGPLAAMLCAGGSWLWAAEVIDGRPNDSSLKERRLIDNGERREGDQLEFFVEFVI